MNRIGTLCLAVLSLPGCVSLADYQVAMANDGSFAAYDRQFIVDPMSYPVFALAGNGPIKNPDFKEGGSQWKGDESPDILPTDRWEITRVVNGNYLAYSFEYDERFCRRQLLMDRKWLAKTCNKNHEMNTHVNEYAYLYIRRDGVVYGWQYINNNKRMPFEKTWFNVMNKGDWSGQPWFKCVERCDKLVNMK
ncbi:hypothetical protein ACFFJT_20815 [Dyella flava]|uniref:Lipoprotein n=1 Tax=Dyella flava TaxID=1920170 RepID=A0ABS2JZ74_9GAMM|nr:hypothetical protein [Dyella flava]MBM7123793.1 hypothetical protein [Dyella flava]